MPFAVSCALHIGITNYGGLSSQSDPEVQLKNGKSVVELTLMPSTPSKASTASRKTSTTETEIIDDSNQPAENSSNEIPEKKSAQFIASPIKKIETKTVRCDNISVTKNAQRKKVTSPKKEISQNTVEKNPVNEELKETVKKQEKQVEQTSQVNGKINSVDSPLIEADQRRKGVSCECEMMSELVVKYPRVSRRKNEEGTVDLNIKIDEHGNVTKIQVIASSGYKRLDKSAVKSIKRAKFTPAVKNGKHVASELKMNITFKLDDFDE